MGAHRKLDQRRDYQLADESRKPEQESLIASGRIICRLTIKSVSSAIWYRPMLAFLQPSEPSSTEKAAFGQPALVHLFS
jgi:hypothetical protein